jgi:hypothetical protein
MFGIYPNYSLSLFHRFAGSGLRSLASLRQRFFDNTKHGSKVANDFILKALPHCVRLRGAHVDGRVERKRLYPYKSVVSSCTKMIQLQVSKIMD